MKIRQRFDYLAEQIELNSNLSLISIRELYHLINWIIISPAKESFKIEFVEDFIKLMIAKNKLIFIDFLLKGLKIEELSSTILCKIIRLIENIELQNKKHFIENVLIYLARQYKPFVLTKKRKSKWFYNSNID